MLNKNLLADLKSYVKSHLAKNDLHLNEDSSQIINHVLESAVPNNLNNYIDNHRKRTFQQILFHFIDQKGTGDTTIYKKAWMDRRHFSKIRSNPDYQIGKNSAIALAMALELTLNETNELLHAAGFSLSDSNTSDLVIQFCLKNKIYNLHDINEALDYFDLQLLGSVK